MAFSTKFEVKVGVDEDFQREPLLNFTANLTQAARPGHPRPRGARSTRLAAEALTSRAAEALEWR